MTSAPWHSAVSADDWAVVSDACLQGVVHACNNRVAALGGIVQLQDHKLASAEEGFASLREEVVRFRALMELLRALMARKGEKREPARMVEALRAAAALLAHHPVARQWTVEVTDEPADVEPVLLWPTDPLRFAVLLLLAAGCDAAQGELRVSVIKEGSRTVTSVLANGSAGTVKARAEFKALARAASSEDGSLEVRPYGGADSAMLTLTLPGLTKAASRR